MTDAEIRRLDLFAVQYENFIFKKLENRGYSQNDVARILKKSNSQISYIYNPLHQAKFTIQDNVKLLIILDDEPLNFLCDLKGKKS